MFQRIQQYPLMTAENRVYRPRAYANPHPDGGWEGWLVFFPLSGGPPVASNRETTQSSLDALANWAANVTVAYLLGALGRALRIAHQPPVLADLAPEEFELLEDAKRLEEVEAAIERETSEIDAEREVDDFIRRHP